MEITGVTLWLPENPFLVSLLELVKVWNNQEPFLQRQRKQLSVSSLTVIGHMVFGNPTLTMSVNKKHGLQ